MLSDEGEILSDLIASGVNINNPKRRGTISELASGFGIKIDGGTLLVQASQSNLGQRTHALVQAMLAVNDMYVLARSRIQSYFKEDVEEFLKANEVRYSTRVKLSGKSGYDHAVDFLIPRSSAAPERLLQAIPSPTKYMVSNSLFAINDAREARSEELVPYVLLNDTTSEVSADILEAFSNYDVSAVNWSDRQSLVDELVA